MGKVANVKFVIGAFHSRNRCFFSNCLSKVQLNTFVVTKSFSRHMASTDFHEWRPEDIINGSKFNEGYACIVVNRKITVPKEIVENLWQNAEFRCTVDGGTNRWRDFLLNHERGNQLKLPDFITGDFDSITQETSDYFSDPSIIRIHTPDQNYTDFTKAINVLEPFLHAKEVKDIIVFHDTSGRLDHIMANIATLYKAPTSLNVYLLGGNSITWLLRPAMHSIHIPPNLVDRQRWCALIPIGGSAQVSSKGLKWDLNEDTLDFEKGIVSSSNTYTSELVVIQTPTSIIWSMGVFNFHDD